MFITCPNCGYTDFEVSYGPTICYKCGYANGDLSEIHAKMGLPAPKIMSDIPDYWKECAANSKCDKMEKETEFHKLKEAYDNMGIEWVDREAYIEHLEESLQFKAKKSSSGSSGSIPKPLHKKKLEDLMDKFFYWEDDVTPPEPKPKKKEIEIEVNKNNKTKK